MTGLKVLFANDDIMTQWVMSDVLAASGFTLTSVCLAQRAVELIEAGAEFDLMLLDVTLPGLDQSGLARRWRHLLRNRPVIYTGRTQHGLAPLQQNESFLMAPFSATGLLQAIDDALDEVWMLPLISAAAASPSYVH